MKQCIPLLYKNVLHYSYNGDHLADLAAVTREGGYVVWISDGMRWVGLVCLYLGR